MKHLKVLICFLATFIAVIKCSSVEQDEKEASKLVQELNGKQLVEGNKMSEASWNYESNMTQANEDRKMEVQKAFAEFVKNNAIKLLQFQFNDFQNATLKRMMKSLTNIGDAILDEPDFVAIKQAVLRMQTNYATAKVPSYKDEKILFSLEPEITNVFETSTDPDELKHYWKAWYNLAGKPNRKDFWKYVNLRNKAAWKNSERNELKSVS